MHEDNWAVTCDFGTNEHYESHEHESKNTGVFLSQNESENINYVEKPSALATNAYKVYAMPLIDPKNGGRTIVTNPADNKASPYGWHDINGKRGAEFTITKGNNVWAQEDINGNNGTGNSPNGGRNLVFNNSLNLSNDPSKYTSAAATNLFYWNNIMHDVWYHYGFDEASGNFQDNNYGRGGTGSDGVLADVQDGSRTNNANFITPTDGRNPRMQMFIWTRTKPNRDSSFDNTIIAHEYGHGISYRLVGGRNRNVLGGTEQMGEGWSDWFGLMLTIKSGDKGTDKRGMGTYVVGHSRSGRGIRPTVYSTDRSANNATYADIDKL